MGGGSPGAQRSLLQPPLPPPPDLGSMSGDAHSAMSQLWPLAGVQAPPQEASPSLATTLQPACWLS